MLDVLSNWKDIYEGTGDSLWLVLPQKSKHGAVAAIRLALNQEGVYRVNTLMYVRERSLKNRKLLFAERPSSTVSPGADTNLTRATPNESGGYAAKGGSSKEQSSSATVPPGKRNVNPMLSLSESMRRGYEMAEKYAKAAFKAGREEAAAKARERTQLLKKKLQERQALKKEVNKLVKGINKMAKSESITWARHKELEELLANYDLKRRRQEVLDRRAELEEYLKENPEAADTMNAADLKYLGTRPLNDLTLDDLRTLKAQVEQLHKEGREALEARRAERREYQDRLADELAAPLLEKAKTLPQRIGAVKGPSDMDKLYVGTVKAQKENEEDRHVGAVKGKAAALKDKINFKTLNPLRMFDLLDGGHGTREGPWVRCVYDPLNNAFDEEIRGKTKRKAAVAEKMTDLGLSPEGLTARREVKGAPSMDGKGWKVEDLLSIYAAMQYETGRKEILFGNFKNLLGPGQWTLEAAELAAGRCIQALTDEERAFAHVLFQDGRENFSRIQKVVAEEYNISLQQEELYMRHHVLEHDSNQGLSVLYEDDKLNDAKADAGLMGDLEKGFIVSRKNIPDGERKGIKLGMYSIWLSQVDDQEHMIAFVRPLRDIRAALTMKNPAAPDMAMAPEIAERIWGKYKARLSDRERREAQRDRDYMSGWMDKIADSSSLEEAQQLI